MYIKKQNDLAVVLGGHVNGYSIINELYYSGIKNIIVIDYGDSIARKSNKVCNALSIDKSSASLLKTLRLLQKQSGNLILFPTDDLQLELLVEIFDEVSSFCYTPLNPYNLKSSLDKYNQYLVCESINIPYPKTLNLDTKYAVTKIESLEFPIIVKPTSREDLKVDVFRNMYFETMHNFQTYSKKIEEFIESGVAFIASEYIPGDDTNIYAYTCFVNDEGEILNEWSGKKLTQYPDNYGVVSSASNEFHTLVHEQGRSLVKALDARGVIEPEFKYDYRDKKFKLMEVNFRSMMWHRVGGLSGVNLHESMYRYATGEKIEPQIQEKNLKVHWVLMLHEIPNLIARKGYWKHFKYNLFGGNIRHWAIYDKGDLKPFFYSLIILTKLMVRACLKRLKVK